MNPPRCDAGSISTFSLPPNEFSRAPKPLAANQRGGENVPAHDAFTRHLQRQPSDKEALWRDAEGLVDKRNGFLVLDDTSLDKPYAQKMELVTYHWRGKYQKVVRGINLLTLLWADGRAPIPCDFQVYDKPIGGNTKNEHFLTMLQKARDRGFEHHMRSLIVNLTLLFPIDTFAHR